MFLVKTILMNKKIYFQLGYADLINLRIKLVTSLRR